MSTLKGKKTNEKKYECLWICKCNHAFGNAHFELYTFRCIRMVNVDVRIDVKNQNGLTIFSSFKLKWELLLERIFFRIWLCVLHIWSNEQPTNNTGRWDTKKTEKNGQTFSHQLSAEFHKHTCCTLISIVCELCEKEKNRNSHWHSHTNHPKFKDFICSRM